MAHIEVVDDDVEVEDYGAVLEQEPPSNAQPSHNAQTNQDHNSRRNPPPSRWKRAGLWSLFCLVFWLAYTMRKHLDQPPKAAHATKRYAAEHKHGTPHRTVARPVITETLLPTPSHQQKAQRNRKRPPRSKSS